MKKSTILLTTLLLSTSAIYAEGPNEYEINYGPNNQKLTLKKSDKFIGVRPTIDVSDMDSLLGAKEASKFNRHSVLGGFQALRAKEGEIISDEELDHIRSLSTIGIGTHVYHTQEDDDTPLIPTGDLYIKFDDKASGDECTQILEDHYLQMIEVRGKREFIVKVTLNSSNPVRTAYDLQESQFITTAEPEFATPIAKKGFTRPTDALLKDQWHLKNTGIYHGTDVGIKTGADARVVDAWEAMQSLGSPDIKVAIIDDGFDYISHPDIRGNHKIVSPYDFTRMNQKPLPGGEVYLDERGTLQGDWHGTACAGVAVGNVKEGNIIGAAPNAKLMPVRWGGDLSDRELENWFKYVTDNGADVVSCSWGAAAKYFPLSTRSWNAIHSAATTGRNGKGSVIVFAAGNDNHDINNPQGGTLDGFAIHPDVIAVAASTSMDKKSWYSNFGKEISICAPSSGELGITTADVTGTVRYRGMRYERGYSVGAYTSDFGGTSSACPLVAGISALVLSTNPVLTRVQVKDILQTTARKIGDPSSYDANGHSINFGYGCVDANAAVLEAKHTL